ncbi:hypothetical protein Tco_0590440 [Tanacetum coccineum]
MELSVLRDLLCSSCLLKIDFCGYGIVNMIQAHLKLVFRSSIYSVWNFFDTPYWSRHRYVVSSLMDTACQNNILQISLLKLQNARLLANLYKDPTLLFFSFSLGVKDLVQEWKSKGKPEFFRDFLQSVILVAQRGHQFTNNFVFLLGNDDSQFISFTDSKITNLEISVNFKIS